MRDIEYDPPWYIGEAEEGECVRVSGILAVMKRCRPGSMCLSCLFKGDPFRCLSLVVPSKHKQLIQLITPRMAAFPLEDEL